MGVTHVDRSEKHPVALVVPANVCAVCGQPAEVIPDELKVKARKVKLGPPLRRPEDDQSEGGAKEQDGPEDREG